MKYRIIIIFGVVSNLRISKILPIPNKGGVITAEEEREREEPKERADKRDKKIDKRDKKKKRREKREEKKGMTPSLNLLNKFNRRELLSMHIRPKNRRISLFRICIIFILFSNHKEYFRPNIFIIPVLLELPWARSR